MTARFGAGTKGGRLGIRPDLVIEIAPKLMAEHDGPVLEKGIKGFDRRKIREPGPDRLKPRRAFLEERYELFRRAG